MVTLKRDAKTESSRRGGYDTSMSSKMNNYDRFQLTRENDKEEEITSKYYDDSPQYKEYIWNELNRTTPRRMLSPEEVKRGVRPEDVQQERLSYRSTFSTASYQASYATSRDEQQAQGITFKAKLMIVAYVAVVVFFLTLIVINSGTLASLRSELNSLNAEANTKNEIVDTTINTPVQNPVQYASKVEANLQNAVPAGDYVSMPVSTPASYSATGNWFDSICDWLGNVVGG